ncbi:MAG: TetR/AcrR family transcriptional regulator [Syntrophomonas sp.]|nr:TetR/AcrR family transcriptional regulator [Syntrophomonas sp.]
MDIKSRIIAAYRNLARTQGFHNVNMNDLAATAGVSKRTLYRYFSGKEAVIEATLDTFMAEVADEAARIMKSEKDPARILSEILKYLFVHGQFLTNSRSFADLKQYYPHLWNKIDRFRLEQVRTVLNFIYSHKQKPLSQDLDLRIVTAIILASIQAVLNPDFILSNNLSFEETARQLSKYLLDSLLLV